MIAPYIPIYGLKYRSTTRHCAEILVLVDYFTWYLKDDTSERLVQEFQPMVEICTRTAEEQLSGIGACGGCDRTDPGVRGSFCDAFLDAYLDRETIESMHLMHQHHQEVSAN